jgi:hypothetical protein
MSWRQSFALALLVGLLTVTVLWDGVAVPNGSEKPSRVE